MVIGNPTNPQTPIATVHSRAYLFQIAASTLTLIFYKVV